MATLSCLIVDHLLKENLIGLKSKKELLVATVESIFLADLRVEDHLNDEVREMMRRREKEMVHLDYQTMFQLIKKQLVKDRKIIL